MREDTLRSLVIEACGMMKVLDRDGERQAVDDYLARAGEAVASSRGWQPISSAPKDGSTIILRSGDVVDTGHWTDNFHTSRPWQGWTWHTLVTKATAKQPSHWMPLPVPPVVPPRLDDEKKDEDDSRQSSSEKAADRGISAKEPPPEGSER